MQITFDGVQSILMVVHDIENDDIAGGQLLDEGGLVFVLFRMNS